MPVAADRGAHPRPTPRTGRARLYGVQPETFRRAPHEGHLLFKLSLEIYQRIRERHERRRTLPMTEQDGAA